MFSKAIQEHQPIAASLKGNTLSQHYKKTANVLKPTPPTMLNAFRPPRPASSNPLKRTASQANSDSITNSQELPDEKRAMKVSIQSPANFGSLNKLHNAVIFDANDFDDDANINLDEGNSPEVTKDPSAIQSSSTLLPDPSNRTSTTPFTPISSTPLPWSSSPSTHRQASPSSNAVANPNPIANQPNVGKRRTLPWLDESNLAADEEDAHKEKTDKLGKDISGGFSGRDIVKIENEKERRKNGMPRQNPHVDSRSQPKRSSFDPAKYLAPQEIQPKREQNPKARPLPDKAYTPLPKDKSSRPLPWNTTASAVKEEQKKLRQGQRKLVKELDGGGFAKTLAQKQKEVVPTVFLSDEQRSVLDLVAEQKKSVFFTGSAGTGKSVLLRETIRVLRNKFKREPDRVAVTASTGLAACNVGGVTLHSFAGIGLGKEAAPELVRKIKRNQKAKNRWMRTKVLIIDEISMVDGDLFDKLEAIARSIRNNGRPFGGIQLVITGDFFQLPPVPDYGRVAKFSFDAATWNTSIEHTIGLTQVFRQKDPFFANMLNEMRLGRLTPKSIDAFRALNRPLGFHDDFEATELFPTRNEVDSANGARMRNLSGKEYEFRAVDGGSILDPEQRSKLLANCMAPPSITLKKGAQVMLIKNIDDMLVNGSVGKVIAFMDEKTFDIYHEDEDEFQAVEDMDVNDENMTKARLKLKQMINKDLTGDTSQKWPLVRFSIADGTSRDLLCQSESWKIELPNGEIQASRSQIPLILAWALSIHKAQGQTLDRVKVDLGKIFEKGQAYVALSRATCQEGLQIMRFDPKKVMAHDRVRSFYDSLYSIHQAMKPKVPQVDSKKRSNVPNDESDFLDSAIGLEEDEDAMQAFYGR